jgi:hypothetical protein
MFEINSYQAASKVQAGTIVVPFIGAEKFGVERAEATAWGAVRFYNWLGEMVEMVADNGVKILGYYNV